MKKNKKLWAGILAVLIAILTWLKTSLGTDEPVVVPGQETTNTVSTTKENVVTGAIKKRANEAAEGIKDAAKEIVAEKAGEAAKDVVKDLIKGKE